MSKMIHLYDNRAKSVFDCFRLFYIHAFGCFLLGFPFVLQSVKSLFRVISNDLLCAVFPVGTTAFTA